MKTQIHSSIGPVPPAIHILAARPGRRVRAPGAVPRAIPGVLLAAMIALASPLAAQSFDVGSDGSLGDVVIASNTTMDLPDDGKLRFRNLTVNGSVTLSFNRNPRNTPVFILAQSNVVVNGTINVDGGTRPANSGGLGGPGGFDGGKPGFGTEVPPGFGYGPGGGAPGDGGCQAANSARGGSYGTLGFGASSGIHGTTLEIPLVGGSGGGGGPGTFSGGGGGGGAILIAANHRVSINGAILARGGFGGTCDNAGSGGAIRLVSFTVEGPGTLNTDNGNTPSRNFGAGGGSGRVRIDTIIRTGLNFTMTGVSTIGGNLLVFPPTVPSLTVTDAAGNAVANSSGPVTFTLPFGSSTNQTITIQASGFARNVPIRLTLTPDTGARVIFDAEVDNAAANPAVVNVPVTVPVNTLVTVHCWTR